MEPEIKTLTAPSYTDHLNIVYRKSRPQLIEDRKAKLIEKIKSVIIEVVYNSEEQLKTNFSDHLGAKLNYHYTYLANLFSKTEGIYPINLKK